MLLRSIIICWLLAALGHTFILEQPGGSAFRHFPQWRYFCKYIAVDSWDWHQTFWYFFGEAFNDTEFNSGVIITSKPKGYQGGTSMVKKTLSIVRSIFLKLKIHILYNSPQRIKKCPIGKTWANQWPLRYTDMDYGWGIMAVPLAKEHAYGRIVLLHKSSALENCRRRTSKLFQKWTLEMNT